MKKIAMKQAIVIVSLMVGSTSIMAAIPVDFSHLVEQVSPAVVSVNATRTLSQQELTQQQVPELLKRFFGHQLIIPQQQLPQERNAYGSAFFISTDGYLLTNHHVVKDASKVTLILHDRREIDAEVVGSDERTDIAVLKVKGGDFPALKIGSVEKLKVGEPVLAIGSPFGFDYSASAGIVSAKSRTVFNEAAVPFIQTDVALNPGNSGGPLFNSRGEVVGVNSRIFSGTGGYMGLSFSIPIDVAMNVAHQLQATGRVTRSYLGVMLQDIDRSLAEAYQLQKPIGTLITQIAENSPAKKAGLKIGDIVTAYNNQTIYRTSDLIGFINQATVNQKVVLAIVREHKPQNITVVLGVAPPEVGGSSQKASETGDDALNQLGLLVRELSDQERARLSTAGVVVQQINYSGLAAQAGIKQYDVITQIGNQKINRLTDFNQVITKVAKNSVVPVYLLRQNQPLILGLRFR